MRFCLLFHLSQRSIGSPLRIIKKYSSGAEYLLPYILSIIQPLLAGCPAATLLLTF